MIRLVRNWRFGRVAALCFIGGAFALSPVAARAQSTPNKTSSKPADSKKPAASKPAPAKTTSTKTTPAKTSSSKPDPKGKKPDPKQAARPESAKPSLLQTFGEWGAYTANSGKARTCYALGQPKDRQPASLKRDAGYVFISHRPGENVRNEVSIIMGFDVKPDQDARAEIGNQSFAMVAKGQNLWVKNAAEEGQMLDAMKKGSRLVIKAASLRGNQSTDTYILSGLAQAVDRVAKECQ